ncbi:MAG: hypothetical protein Q4G52_10710 [Clostridia bacterium]|nr:hypothetical protein [Clostridia bacterium]
MGTLADSLFTVLMSWVRALVGSIWALFSSDRTTILEFLGQNWLLIAAVLIVAGLVVDWLIWLLRWQPYHLWAVRVRRLLRLPPPEEDDDEEIDEAIRNGKRARETRAQVSAQEQEPARAQEPEWEESWLPLEQPHLDEQDERLAFEQAESVPDEALGVYPGMRYGAPAQSAQSMSDTQRYAAVHAEGPGAAEVARRRAEIDAWQEQLREEARQKAEAERAAREAYEAEQARLAQEAYEAEQARLAQEEYERQLAEYERQKEQYEREMAEYERQKAAYDAEMARRSAEAAFEEGRAQPEQTQGASTRRRRAAKATYSDYVAGEPVAELPDPPAWPEFTQQELLQPEKTAQPAANAKRKTLLSQVAKLVEPEQEEISGVKALPPRVNMHEAYKPPARPAKSAKPGRRKR